MTFHQPAIDAVQAFAADWVARNIQPGPFSCDDPMNQGDAIRSFTSEAAQSGLTEVELVQGIGAVPAFLARAFADAAATWRAERHRQELRARTDMPNGPKAPAATTRT